VKVLMFGWELPPVISGGLGTACQGLAEGLDSCGVGLRFVLPRATGAESVPGGEVLGADAVALPAGIEVVPVASDLRPYEGVKSYAVRRRADSTTSFEGGYGPGLGDEVARYALVGRELGRADDFDLIHAHDWMTYGAGAAAAQVSGKPLVVHVHACEIDRAGADGDPELMAAEQAGFDVADRIVCVSGYTARLVRENYRVDPAKLRVVHNGNRGGRKRAPRRRPDPGTVLFLGRLTRQKAPERFLEAAARVAGLEPEARFVMAGDGELRADLESRARALGLEERIEFPGFLAGPAVERAFQDAAVFVLPSASEPFGLVALEAMDRGVPVVLTRTSGVAEAVRCTLKVDSRDVEALADRVLAVLRHPALAGELAREGRAEVARLTWTRQARKLVGVYRELLA
jgi:glycogen synthase